MSENAITLFVIGLTVLAILISFYALAMAAYELLAERRYYRERYNLWKNEQHILRKQFMDSLREHSTPTGTYSKRDKE